MTDASVRALSETGASTAYHWDSKLKGFGVRVSSGGTKSFVVLVRSGRRQTIGRYPTISLSEARIEAKRVLAEKTLGRLRPDRLAYEDALKLFLASSAKKNRGRTVSDYKRLLGRFSFGRKPLYDIRRRDITSALPDAPSEARHMLVAAKVFFAWCVRHEYLLSSPANDLRAPSMAVPRDRVLSDEELAKLYRAARETPYPFGPIVLLLLLTGQRRGEIAALKWSYIEPATISLPASLTKNRRRHSFPKGALAASIIEGLPQLGDDLFPASRSHVRGRPTTIYNGWPKDTEALRTAAGISHFTLHDIRRSVASGLASLGTAPHVVERILNHVSGQISGVALTYNRYSYMEEMRQALSAWEERILTIVK